MEMTMQANSGTKQNPVWRMWIDTREQVVSFHEQEGARLLEFRSQEMFMSCLDQYTGRHYRYQ